ncbi:MAG: hypothetical protein CMH30_07780 [Micavibrio sp.]|nr:hypothetical protein [Micavibrio sp.]
MSESELVLKYDPLTIKHLGVSLYSQLPSVLSELVSNAYDADADNVSINLVEIPNKEIIVTDDGEGMNFDELNEKYLLIGRNRRLQNNAQKTVKKKRPIIGKKGLGKLSVFGVCKEVEIKTIKDGVLNHFSMDLDKIEKSKGVYYPTIIKKNEVTEEDSGTVIHLKKIKRKTPFDIDSISNSLSKKFTIFDQMNTLISMNGQNTSITNEMKFESLDIEFEWSFPSKDYDTEYQHWEKIKGKIITPSTPLKDTQMKGIYLTSRGKIVNEAEFYDARDNDQFHTYVTGYLTVDFIDDFAEDIISTDRHSLIWENDEAIALKKYLQVIIRKINNDWGKKRAQKKAEKIKENGGHDIQTWKSGLPTYEQKLADQIINPILKDPSIDTEQSSSIINGVIDQFDNKAFKGYASELAETLPPEELPKILQLMNDWKITEIRELSALAEARISVINKFEQLLDNNTKEVPTLHNFLKKFSWLLDPRILEFDDEVKYSEILKKSYPEENLEEKDRRIDFLCSNALGGILYVIEIKRSNYSVDLKAIEQAYAYKSFLEEKYSTQSSFSNVVCFVIGGSKSSDHVFKSKEKTYTRTGEVFVKTYTELLEQSKKYHSEFIEAHRFFNKS